MHVCEDVKILARMYVCTYVWVDGCVNAKKEKCKIILHACAYTNISYCQQTHLQHQ